MVLVKCLQKIKKVAILSLKLVFTSVICHYNLLTHEQYSSFDNILFIPICKFFCMPFFCQTPCTNLCKQPSPTVALLTFFENIY